MLMELIIFAVVLVFLQTAVSVTLTYVMFELMTDRRFIGYYVKKYIKLLTELNNELDEETLKDEEA